MIIPRWNGVLFVAALVLAWPFVAGAQTADKYQATGSFVCSQAECPLECGGTSFTLSRNQVATLYLRQSSPAPAILVVESFGALMLGNATTSCRFVGANFRPA